MRRALRCVWSLYLLLILFSVVACHSEADTDARRAGAIRIEIGLTTSDELYPNASDSVDWKMVFVPGPGTLTVGTYWDTPKEIFDVQVGVYDRFGIPIKKAERPSAAPSFEMSAYLVEPGLHYIKLSSTSGQSVYSIITRHETNYEGIKDLDERVMLSDSIDLDSAIAKKNGEGEADPAAGGGAAAGGGGMVLTPAGGGAAAGGAAAGGAAAGGAAAGGAAAGGVVLPTAVEGGLAMPGGGGGAPSGGATIVAPKRSSSGGGSSFKRSQPKNVAPARVDTDKGFKDIASDVRGKYRSVEADLLLVSGSKKGAKLKLNAGTDSGVEKGMVGEIYQGGSRIKGGRFKITSVSKRSCRAATNAPKSVVKKATKFVIKVPE